LLTEIETVTGMHRKNLIRLLNAPTLERKPRQRGRGFTYTPEVARLVRQVRESPDYVFAERLMPSLLPMAPHLATFNKVALTPDLDEKLARITEATARPLLRSAPRLPPPLPRRGPERPNQLRQPLAMGRLPRNVTEAGHRDTDPVHHFGRSAEG
jgi:hypothetical protein